MFVDKNDIPKQDYLVLCNTITYNQAPYIEDTMNGLCMQQTDFPFACFIIDDASTDGEQDVIKTYLDKHFAMDSAETYELELANVTVVKHKANPNCTFAVYLLKRNLWKEPDLKYAHRKPWVERCKYIALCEGDDYWTDPLKLQKQVDFLESHEEYDMVCGNFEVLWQNKQYIELTNLYNSKDLEHRSSGVELTLSDLYHAVIPQILTVVYRRDLLVNDDFYKSLTYKHDVPMYYSVLRSHRVWLMKDVVGVYRRHEMGIATRLSDYQRIKWELKVFEDLYLHDSNNNDLREIVLFYLKQHIYSYVKEEVAFNLHYLQEQMSKLYKYENSQSRFFYVVLRLPKAFLLRMLK